MSPREVNCGIVGSFLFTWRKVRLANTKLPLDKQKAAMGIKDNPASCHQAELPNQPAPIFASSTSFSTCRNQWGWCVLKQFQLLWHPCMSMPQAPLPSCVLVPHLLTAPLCWVSINEIHSQSSGNINKNTSDVTGSMWAGCTQLYYNTTAVPRWILCNHRQGKVAKVTTLSCCCSYSHLPQHSEPGMWQGDDAGEHPCSCAWLPGYRDTWP